LAELGWRVTAIDGSSSAIATLRERAAQRGLSVNAQVSDLTAPGFMLPDNSFQLVLIAYYLQRDLFAKIAPTLQPGGITIAIVHIPGPGEQLTANRTSPGELKMLFAGWDILHYYEGASRDPAHKRPVAEIVAQRQARE
jgi:SAM-dependent methyltransferase